MWLQKRKSHKQIGSAKNAVQWLLSFVFKYFSVENIFFVKCTTTLYAHFYAKTQYKGVAFIENNLQQNIHISLYFISLSLYGSNIQSKMHLNFIRCTLIHSLNLCNILPVNLPYVLLHSSIDTSKMYLQCWIKIF